MGLLIDGTTIATSANVYVDGVAMNNVYIDGTLVWTKAAAGTWKTAWSGSVLLVSDDEYEGDMSEHVTSNTNLTGKTLQADATYTQTLYYDDGSIESYSESLVAAKNNSSEKTNLPWLPNISMYSQGLYSPTVIGTSVEFTANVYTGQLVGYTGIFYEEYEITALYYYDK